MLMENGAGSSGGCAVEEAVVLAREVLRMQQGASDEDEPTQAGERVADPHIERLVEILFHARLEHLDLDEC